MVASTGSAMIPRAKLVLLWHPVATDWPGVSPLGLKQPLSFMYLFAPWPHRLNVDGVIGIPLLKIARAKCCAGLFCHCANERSESIIVKFSAVVCSTCVASGAPRRVVDEREQLKASGLAWIE